MLPDRVWNPGPLTYESGALPIAQQGQANMFCTNIKFIILYISEQTNTKIYKTCIIVTHNTCFYMYMYLIIFKIPYPNSRNYLRNKSIPNDYMIPRHCKVFHSPVFP